MAVALAAAFAVSVLDKWRAVEWLQARGPRLLSEMAACRFCLSWWTCAALALAASLFTLDFRFIAAAVLAAPLTRALV